MLSIVIPTHNRASSAVRLAETLDSHEASQPFEIVFALDGCRDNTRESLESLSFSTPLKLVESPGLGPAGARNTGVAASEGDLLLFVDDDVVPQPGMVDAHLSMHRDNDLKAVVGPYSYAPEIPVNALDFRHRDWWRSRFEAMADPTHKFTHQDLLTGNLSVSRNTYEGIGGLDESFKGYGHEDWEFGVRLLKSGGRIEFAEDARACHYPVSRPGAFLSKCNYTGRADVYFSRKHPEVFNTLPLHRCCRRNRGLWLHLKTWIPLLASQQARTIAMMGYFFDRNVEKLWDSRMLALWRRCETLAYLMGAVSAAGGLRELETFLKQFIPRPDWPDRMIGIRDLELLDGFSEISDAAGYDEIHLVTRVGGRSLDWIKILCRGEISVSSRQIADLASMHAAWPAWRSLVCPENGRRLTEGELDTLAWRQLRDGLHSLPQLTPKAFSAATTSVPASSLRVSVIEIADGKDGVDAYSELNPVQVLSLSPGGNLGKKLAQTSAECEGDVIAFVRPGDHADQLWLESALRHFSDPKTACVVSPVVPKSIRTRGEELCAALADLRRVGQWDACDLQSWNPAYVLKEFNMASHRLAVSRSVLKKYCSTLPFEPANPVELSLSILGSLILSWERVIYEPKAVIWRASKLHTPEVRELAATQSRGVIKLLFGKLTAGPGRVRALRMIPKLTRYQLRRLARSALKH